MIIVMPYRNQQLSSGTDGKKLAIVLQNEITTYLFRAFPLCIILTNDKLKSWYYQHFIQICSQTTGDGYVMLDYAESFNVYQEVLIRNPINMESTKKIPDIINFIIDRINNNNYVIICLNEYCLPQKPSFQKMNFIHESLIYGYDNKNKQFLSIGFNENMSFIKIRLGYEDVIRAFNNIGDHYKESAPYAEDEAVQLLTCPKVEREHPFNLKRFVNNIYNYINGTGDGYQISNVVPPSGIFKPEKVLVKYGLNVFNDVSNCLNVLLEDRELIDYRAFHFLEENSRGLINRLNYINSKHLKSNDLNKMIQNYFSIHKKLQTIKLKFIKQSYLAKGTHEKKKIINELILDINSIKTENKILLTKIYEQLEVSTGIIQ